MVLEGSSEEEDVVAVVVLAAGASTTSVVARGFPLVLEAASDLCLEVELVAALAWEVGVDLLLLVVAELVAVLDLDLVLVVVVVDMALVEVLVGLALVVDQEVVEGLALVEQEGWEDSVEGWVVAGTQRGLVVAPLEFLQSKK